MSIRKIGDITYMFNYNPWSEMIVDDNWTDGLRCYQDDSLGLYSTGLADSCEYVLLDADKVSSPAQCIKVFPNPSSGWVLFDSEKSEMLTLKLFNLTGQTLFHETLLTGAKVDFSNYPKGLYLVSVETPETTFVDKLILM